MDSSDFVGDGRPFERVYYCRVKNRNPFQVKKKGEGKGVEEVRKSYWVYPFEAKQGERPEEVERVTNEAISTKVRSRLLRDKFQILEFVGEFFAKFCFKNCEMVNYVMQEAAPVAGFVSSYNELGWRHIYGLRFSDFDFYGDEEESLVDVNQSVIIVVSKYPFKGFFARFLMNLFQDIRVLRLQAFSEHFNSEDVSSIAKIDAKLVKQVAFSHQDPQPIHF